MRHIHDRPYESAVIHFDRATLQFLIVCEAHSLSYPAETSFDARLLLDLHNNAHGDVDSDLYLPVARPTQSEAQTRGHLLRALREGLGLSIEVTAGLADVPISRIVATEEGRLEDDAVEGTLAVTYSTVAAGLSNARRA